jgi:hypothetical protein
MATHIWSCTVASIVLPIAVSTIRCWGMLRLVHRTGSISILPWWLLRRALLLLLLLLKQLVLLLRPRGAWAGVLLPHAKLYYCSSCSCVTLS